MTNSTAIATGSAFATAPATFAAAWAAFGIVAPEVVLPVTGTVMALTALTTYFAADALNSIAHNDEVHTKMIGDAAHHPVA